MLKSALNEVVLKRLSGRPFLTAAGADVPVVPAGVPIVLDSCTLRANVESSARNLAETSHITVLIVVNCCSCRDGTSIDFAGQATWEFETLLVISKNIGWTSSALGSCSAMSSRSSWSSSISAACADPASSSSLTYSLASPIQITTSASLNVSKGDKAACDAVGNVVRRSYRMRPLGKASGENAAEIFVSYAC